MITKDELNELRYLAQDISEKEAELEALYTLIEGVSSPRFTDETKGGGQPIDILDLYEKIIRKQQEIRVLSIKRYEARENIFKIIIKILDFKECELIYMRYFENRTWNDISERLNYTIRHLTRLHRGALEKIKT